MLTGIGLGACLLAIVLLFAAVGAQNRKIEALQAQVLMLQSGQALSSEHALAIGAVVQSLGERVISGGVRTQAGARLVH